MGIFDGYLICSDIDGTLIKSGPDISIGNRNAIDWFMSEGGLFTVATGRFPEYIKTEFSLPVNAPVIAVNGTVIYDIASERVLWDCPCRENTADVLSFLFDGYAKDIQRIVLCGFDSDRTFRFPDYDAQFIAETFLKGAGHKQVYVFESADKAVEAEEQLISLFGDRFTFVRAWPQGLELYEKSAGKGTCIRLMKERFCEGIHTTVGIGDFENDISLLSSADIGYATGNALDCVKSIADYITPCADCDAVAFVIEHLKKEIIYAGNS